MTNNALPISTGPHATVAGAIDPARRTGTCIPLDFDEFMQALYGLFRTVKGGPQESAAASAATLGNFAFAAGVGAAIIGASFFAVRGGFNDFREAFKRDGALKTRLSKSAQELDKEHPNHALNMHVHAQTCDDVQFERQRNGIGGGIGLMSSASGTSMLVRSVEETVLQAGLSVAAKGFNVAPVLASHPMAAAASSLSSIIGTFVLGPLAAGFSTALGALMVHQSRFRLQRLRIDQGQLESHLPNKADSAEEARYLAFVRRKFGARLAFLQRFRNWNAIFLAGGVVFTGTTLVKAGLAAAAVLGLGAGLLAGPVGATVLLVVGLVGAVMLGAGSLPLMVTGAKNQRHQADYHDDHPGVDRCVLSMLDAVCPPDGADDHPAFALRSTLYASIVERKAALLALLGAAWMDQQHGAPRTEAPPEVDASRRLARLDLALPPWWRRLRAKAASGVAFLRAMVGGKGLRAAAVRARRIDQQACPRVSQAALSQWLSTQAGAQASVKFMRATLLSEQRFLWDKCERLRHAPEIDRLKGALATEQARLARIDGLLADLDNLDNLDKAGRTSSLLQRFMALQACEAPPATDVPLEVACTAFAEYCRERCAPDLAQMAGVLLGAELDVARLRHRICSVQSQR